MKLWLQSNNIEMHSTRKKGKPVIPERFIRILKKKIYKYMTSILRNMYINKLYYIINQHSNTYHSKIIKEPVDPKSSAYIEFNEEKSD